MMRGIVKGYAIKVVWSEEDDCYIVRAPALQGCVTHGDTLKECVKEIEEVIELWLESAKKHGDPIPKKDGR